MGTRLKERYDKQIQPAMLKEFGYKNRMAVPKLQKIVLNMGVGREAQTNSKVFDSAASELATISGQKPVITKARKSIAAFKLRTGMPVGVSVTLRGDMMYEFLDRLVNAVLPRVRDFRGISPRSFDGRGSYTLAIKEQINFPEIDFNKVEKIRGLNISIVTTAGTDEEGRSLLRHFGMPFSKN